MENSGLFTEVGITSNKNVSETQRNKQVVLFQQQPPPKPPDSDLLGQAPSPEPQEPPNASQLATILLQPKPPDPGDSVTEERRETKGVLEEAVSDVKRRREQTVVFKLPPLPEPPDSDRLATDPLLDFELPPLLEPSEPPDADNQALIGKEHRRAKSEFSEGGKSLEQIRVKEEFGEVSIRFDLMGQAHINSRMWEKEIGMWGVFTKLEDSHYWLLNIGFYWKAEYWAQYSIIKQEKTNPSILIPWFVSFDPFQEKYKAEPDPDLRETSPPLQRSTVNLLFPSLHSSWSTQLQEPPECTSSRFLSSPMCSTFRRHACQVHFSIKNQKTCERYQKCVILSTYGFLLCNCFGRHVKGFSVKLEVSVHDREEIAIVNTYSMCGNLVLVFKVFNDREVWNLISFNYVTVGFNLKTQIDMALDACQWMESEDMSLDSAIWNSLINEFAQQGRYVKAFKYFKSMKLLVHLHLRIFISLFSVFVDQLELQIGKMMYAHVVRTCDDTDEFLETTLVEMHVWYSHVSRVCRIFDQFNTKSGGSPCWYAIIEWCGSNEAYYESTYVNLGGMWVKKVQPRNAESATGVFDLTTYSHNGHSEKGVHLFMVVEDILHSDVMLLSIIEVAPVNILTTTMELLIFLAGTIIDESIALGNMKEDSNMWPIKDSKNGSEIVYVTRLCEGSLPSFQQWDPEEFNFPMAATVCDYCWSGLHISYGLLNFVFDRGKFSMDANSSLEDKAVLKGSVLIETGSALIETLIRGYKEIGQLCNNECSKNIW